MLCYAMLCYLCYFFHITAIKQSTAMIRATNELSDECGLTIS